MLNLATEFVTQTCCYANCGVVFAMTRVFDDNRRNDHAWWYCPNGHQQHYSGDSERTRLKAAEAREVALKDQLSAAIRDRESANANLLRERSRMLAGVCPCCSRSFENVRRHMHSQHPDYAVGKVPLRFECACGAAFETWAGLRIHQGKARKPGWDAPAIKYGEWRRHLSVVG